VAKRPSGLRLLSINRSADTLLPLCPQCRGTDCPPRRFS
jgi:hypothetical protein